MFSLNAIVLLISCVVLVTSLPATFVNRFETEAKALENYEAMEHARYARSPQHGSVNIDYTKDQRGREASVQYNHNLYTSSDGRGSIDAYAQGSRNFDYNRNNFGGGIQGKWRF
ncbi:uncharacterized protein LOC133331984 [Musca vetustissima]|uniref:uncharacterized protein LOC133331984 n=1 Tax=Musca vetustissima TaxID=27455 RepID=UPI002AB7B9EA|nr:uncharacterized protein LOC133331984 [Musca vetustissima]